MWTVVEGMWLSSAVLFPIGLFLTWKATTDSKLFEIDAYLKPFKWLFEKLKPKSARS